MYYLIISSVIVVNVVFCVKPPCVFTPDKRLECINYIKLPGNITGCSIDMESYEFTGIKKDIAGDLWINVKTGVVKVYICVVIK
jgi:hypothetical protein